MRRWRRVLVLRQFKIAFLPVPKSGCTSIKWQLAELAGLSPERFTRSRTAEVTPALAIHDMDLWEPEYRWSDCTDAERHAIVASDEWLRMSVVRDPATRLWSAWQSKLLLREPRFVGRFGGEPWFPHDVGSAEELVESFRAFVDALGATSHSAPSDPHWDAQHEMLADLDLNFVGRAERPEATSARLQQQVGDRADVRRHSPRENTSPLRYSAHVYDDDAAALVNRLYADDFSSFGYEPLDPGRSVDVSAEREWRDAVESLLPVTRELIARHLRIGELLQMLVEADAGSGVHSGSDRL